MNDATPPQFEEPRSPKLLTDRCTTNSTLQKLEFPVIRQALASHCATALGKDLAGLIVPINRGARIRHWHRQVVEVQDLIPDCGWPPLGGVHDIRPEVHASHFPSPLEPSSLARTAETLAATKPLHDWFRVVVPRAPTLERLGHRLVDLNPLAARISECVDPGGQVFDHASPKLAGIRTAIETARRHARTVFDRLLRQASVSKWLQYASTTFHDDRMVLPLKAEYRGRIPGIIHRSSDSGSTLFVEPAESVELNNSIVNLKDREREEINRILWDLTHAIQLESAGILESLRVMAIVDLIAAKVRFALERGYVTPEINDDGILEVFDARHPVLVELFRNDVPENRPGPVREVVPIDVRLGTDFDLLVITGPNTGGKTVALKTMGLLAIMNQSGLPIPGAPGSKLPIYDRIHIDVGDEQNLQQSLSTFSAHISAILPMLADSGPRSLVLLDELGAGTDPDEGAAIGRAVLEEFLRLGVKTVITTHLSALKALAFTTPRVDNASVDFDVKTLRPTFRLRLGEPGNSQALVIARRLGMPESLVRSAHRCLDDATRLLHSAIAGTIESRREAEQARRQAHEAQAQAQQEMRILEQHRESLRIAEEQFNQWTRWVAELKPGDSVHLRSLDGPARVVRIMLHRQRALVTTGAMDIEMDLRELRDPTGHTL